MNHFEEQEKMFEEQARKKFDIELSVYDVIQKAQTFIEKNYGSQNNLAYKAALHDLKIILRRQIPDQDKVNEIYKMLPGLKDSTSFHYSDLIFHPPLQWFVHPVEIAYDISQETKVLVSKKLVIQAEQDRCRELSEKRLSSLSDSSFLSRSTDCSLNASAKVSTSFQPISYLSAKANFGWAIDARIVKNSSLQKVSQFDTQWDKRAQEALSKQYDSIEKIVNEENISHLHLSFSVRFYNLTDEDLFFVPGSVSVPVYAGEKHILDAKIDDPVRDSELCIPKHQFTEFKFRGNIDTSNTRKLIDMMRSEAPRICPEHGQFKVYSKDKNIFSDAIQKSCPSDIYSISCGEIVWNIFSSYHGKKVSIGDAFHAVNALYDVPPFGFDEYGNCISFMGKNFDSSDWNELPFIANIPNSNSLSLSSKFLNQPMSNDLKCYILQISKMSDYSFDEQTCFFKFFLYHTNRGNRRAQFNLGVCYKNGNGVEKNVKEAVSWYRKSAEQGFARTQCILGVCYEQGYGVEKNLEEAVLWWLKAANQDDSDAQCNLGVCYEQGYGVEKNLEEAVSWYRKSAERGGSMGQYNLGYCYLIGSGVEPDLQKAIEWMENAEKQGCDEAIKELKKIRRWGKLYKIWWYISIFFRKCFRKVCKPFKKRKQE